MSKLNDTNMQEKNTNPPASNQDIKKAANIVKQDTTILGNVKDKQSKRFKILLFITIGGVIILLISLLGLLIYNPKNSSDVYASIVKSYESNNCQAVISQSNTYFNNLKKQDTYMVLIAEKAYDCAVRDKDWPAATLYSGKVSQYSTGQLQKDWQLIYDESRAREYFYKDRSADVYQGEENGPLL